LITSLNLYDYSMINNIEYGVHFTKNILNPTDKLFDETEHFTDELIFEKSETVFVRQPQYKKKLFGLTKAYQNSTVLHDVSDNFFNGKNYEVKYLKEFDYEELTDVDKLYDKKPQREEKDQSEQEIEYKQPKNKFKVVEKEQEVKTGYCIRTGVEIPYDRERPMCYSAWQMWSKYKDYDYPENFCHGTGRKSNGKTSMSRPFDLV